LWLPVGERRQFGSSQTFRKIRRQFTELFQTTRSMNPLADLAAKEN
jgi:hypothetical protein